jgi:hypothetical protein
MYSTFGNGVLPCSFPAFPATGTPGSSIIKVQIQVLEFLRYLFSSDVVIRGFLDSLFRAIQRLFEILLSVYGHVIELDYIGTSVKSRSLGLLDLALLPSSDITTTNTGIPPLFSVSSEPVIPTPSYPSCLQISHCSR